MRRCLLAGIAVAIVLFGAPSTGLASPGKEAGAVVVRAAPQQTAIEGGIRGCANRERRARGLAPLALSEPLARAARLHARNMARLGFFDHTDPRGRGVGERVAIFDQARRFSYIGENIAAGQGSASSACDSWMSSAGHRANTLNPEFTHIGAGFASGGPYRRYYVQVFGTPSSR
jgi:uncharacterized protein YkwD